MDVHFLRNLERDGCDTMVTRRVSVLAVLQVQCMSRGCCGRGVDVAHIELICSIWNCHNFLFFMTFQNQKLGDVPSSIILNMMKKEKEKLGERTKIKNWNIILKFERKSARTVHTMYLQKLLHGSWTFH